MTVTVQRDYKSILFLLQCMREYVEFEVVNGAYEVSCPDMRCSKSAALGIDEISALVRPSVLEKHLKFRLNHGQYLYICKLEYGLRPLIL